jgi:hypothetical protein
MASAIFNMQNNLFFADLGFEPNEESAQSHTNYSTYWDPNHIDWSDLGFLDSGDIGFNLTEQQLLGDFHWGDISTMSRGFWPNQISTNRNINLEDSFLPENTQQTDILPMSLSPPQIFPLLSNPLSPDSSLASTSSLSNYQSPSVQLQTPDIQPLSSFASLPPSKTHICTICQPPRSFSSPQGLK